MMGSVLPGVSGSEIVAPGLPLCRPEFSLRVGGCGWRGVAGGLPPVAAIRLEPVLQKV